ncbi:hypothetical protein SAMN05892877_1764 [Rhizobium subbaraonis]|uniref:DUF6950 domain-containing protein n=1 Tax=Rhizobium subbaraonis TaxID=908946 RepID=A0A285V333_9HYPH|nr:hypothetical protein [Rhizobium subbaraonis]SOC48470.1 hypothetical protein SAMN05892877_1764 [Rhizobium subbaraonis]
MTIVRKDDWYSSLSQYIDAAFRRPFAYGEFDCTLFAAGAVEAMTGVNLYADYAGRYQTLAGGLRHLKKLGFDNHVDYAASLFEEVHPSMAQVGDIAVVDTETGHGLGIVQGSRIYVAQPGALGLGLVDLLQASRAFRV